jgi:hypothetical protein
MKGTLTNGTVSIPVHDVTDHDGGNEWWTATIDGDNSPRPFDKDEGWNFVEEKPSLRDEYKALPVGTIFRMTDAYSSKYYLVKIDNNAYGRHFAPGDVELRTLGMYEWTSSSGTITILQPEDVQ